jgi:hypothetical protein
MSLFSPRLNSRSIEEDDWLNQRWKLAGCMWLINKEVSVVQFCKDVVDTMLPRS